MRTRSSWARAQGGPHAGDERTCMAAASEGHLELLKWARAQTPPAPWDGYACCVVTEVSEVCRDRGVSCGPFRRCVVTEVCRVAEV